MVYSAILNRDKSCIKTTLYKSGVANMHVIYSTFSKCSVDLIIKTLKNVVNSKKLTIPISTIIILLLFYN